MTEDQIATLAAIILGGIASNPNEKVSESSLTRAVLLARAMPAALEATKPVEPVASYLVMLNAGAGGSIAPAGGFTAKEGDVIVVTITPDEGNEAAVGGTTPGTLAGNVFTTDPVAADGSVDVTFAPVGGATRRGRG